MKKNYGNTYIQLIFLFYQNSSVEWIMMMMGIVIWVHCTHFGQRKKHVDCSLCIVLRCRPHSIYMGAHSFNESLFILSAIKCGDSYFFLKKKKNWLFVRILYPTNFLFNLMEKANVHIHSDDIERKKRVWTKFIGNELIACDFHEMTWKI